MFDITCENLCTVNGKVNGTATEWLHSRSHYSDMLGKAGHLLNE